MSASAIDTLKALRVAEEVIQDYIRNNKMFTSIDIANTVKLKGLWIRNSEVAKYLRDNVDNMDEFLNGDYVSSQIVVVIDAATGRTTRANLYHPAIDNPHDYVNTQQRALTPAEVDAISSKNVAPTPTVIAPPAPAPAVPVAPPIPADSTKPVKKSLLNWFK